MTPPAKKSVISAIEGLWLLALILFAVSALFNGVFLTAILYLTLLAVVIPLIVKRTWILQGQTYEVDESGIAFFKGKHRTSTSLAWADIGEAECSKEGVISLYSRGRDIVVRLSPLYQNYLATLPVLLEKLQPLWREKYQQVYTRTIGSYWIPLIVIPLIAVGIGVEGLTVGGSRALLWMGLAGYAAYRFIHKRWRGVQSIKLTLDSVEVIKTHGREHLPVTTITSIELVPDQISNDYPPTLLLVSGDRHVIIDNMHLNPTLLYFVLTIWYRDNFVSNSGGHL